MDETLFNDNSIEKWKQILFVIRAFLNCDFYFVYVVEAFITFNWKFWY